MAPSTYALRTAADRQPPQAKPAKKKGPNTPRLDPYQRLISRFYEPLRLLHVLGQTRGKHTAVPKCVDPTQKSRRRLLDNLAYLCVFGKGGKCPPAAAIGMEGVETGYVLWLASNHAADLDRMEPFLNSVIGNLRRYMRNPPGFTEAQFIEQCVAFAQPRIEKEQDLLVRFVACIINKGLERPYSDADRALVQWLQTFLDKSPLELCYLAYEERQSDSMRLVTRRGHPLEDESHQSDVIQRYMALRHIIGRLAHHIRAPKLVLLDARRHRNIFDKGVTSVRRVSPVSSVPKPEPDGLTTPSSILKRMVKPDHPKLKRYQDGMDFLDRRLNIGDKIVASYNNKDFRPCVHCEVQVLEHFYENSLRFSHNDRFVACSKPACYCCHLYFRAHPADPEEPRCHQKIWPAWSPPLIENGHRDEKKYRHQLYILNSMIESIRKQALAQIENKVTDMEHHQDSTTGITRSDTSDILRLEDQMDNLSIIGKQDLNHSCSTVNRHTANSKRIGHKPSDDEASDSDSSLSTQSISSRSARSFHETSATDTAPEEDDEHGGWQSYHTRDPVDTSNDAVGSTIGDAADDSVYDTATASVYTTADATADSDGDDSDLEVGGGAAL
ncbi:uncharacterized protein PG986_002269 [Apiospora aurea]|uniref:Uncharacterized protein n=1 Tax=Apiospora aurea TaxID=335848 RepID=A0ABR1QZ55_9PEZI